MGMYDHITSSYPLPASGLENHDFQTKSLFCELETYRITMAGLLERMVAKDNWKHIEVTTEVRFYNSIPNPTNIESDWVEFSAYFVKGKLISMNLINDTRTTTPTEAKDEV